MRYVKNPKLKIRTENNGYIVYLPPGKIFWFNETAKDILAIINDYEKVEDIVSFLRSKYDIFSIDTVKLEVDNTVQILEMIGCISRVKNNSDYPN